MALRIQPCVQEALADGKPVVALESTIVTHGMPYPHNLRMAREVEEIVRQNGSVPATVGVLRGKIHVGLSDSELRFLAESKHTMKVSRRDLPYVISQHLSGGTTVSGTIIAAHKAGISIFVTGGIGGVHRGVETTSSLELGLGSGVLIAVPIPEEAAASGHNVEEAVQQALSEAGLQGVRGKDVTPYVLQRVNELTGGKSLGANLALIRNNAKVGSLIAVSLSKVRKSGHWQRQGAIHESRKHAAPPEREEDTLSMSAEVNSPGKEAIIHHESRPVVIGGINVDFIAKATNEDLLFGGQTNPGRVYQTFGGVGRNLADCLSRLGAAPLLISAVGSDKLSESVLRYCSHMDLQGISQLQGHNTAAYCAFITDQGELSLGLGDFHIHQQITENHLSRFEEHIRRAALLCIDGNVPVTAIQYACRIAKQCQIPVCYEPTDQSKASKPFLSDTWKELTYTSPNLLELRAINQSLGNTVPQELPSSLDAVLGAAVMLARPLLQHLQCVMVTLGAHGLLLCGWRQGQTVSLRPGIQGQEPSGDLFATHYPAAPIPREEIMNVSGAGDSLLAGIITGIVSGLDTDTSVRMGLLCARLSLRSHDPISQHISPASVSLEHVRMERWPEPRRWHM